MEEIEIIDPYGFIYLTTNIINGKKYIGQKTFNKNWQYYLGSGNYLKNAVKKYGRENFSRDIIAIAYSQEILNELEIGFIKNHNAVDSEDYYNIASGGLGGGIGPKSAEHNLKNSLAHKGKHLSQETKLKLSKSHIGKKASEETRQKMSESQKGREKSEEEKRQISARQIKINTEQAKEIREKYATDKYTLNKLAKEYSVGTTCICNVVNFKGVYKKIA